MISVTEAFYWGFTLGIFTGFIIALLVYSAFYRRK